MPRRFVTILFAVLLAGLAAGPAQTPPAEEPSLGFVESSTGTLQIASQGSSEVHIPLTIESTTGKPVTGIRIDPPSLWMPGREAVAATISPAPATLSAYGTAPLLITAMLPYTGTYRGALRVTYDGSPQKQKSLKLAIEIARVRPAVNIDVADLGGVVDTLPAWRGGAPLVFKTHIQNNDADPIVLRAPLLRSITFKPKADVTAAVPSTVSVRFADDQQATLPPNRDSEVSFALDGITRPGRYDAAIRIGSEGTTPVDKSVAIYARQSYWILFFWVAVGLLLSFWYRTYAGVIRPRLQLERKISLLLADLGDYIRLAGDDTEAVAFLQALRTELSNDWDRLAASGQLVGSTALDTYPTRVALAGQWIERWNGLTNVRPVSVRDDFRAKLRDVADALLVSTTTDFSAQQTTLETLPQKLDEALATAMSKMLTDLKAEITKRNDPQFDPLLEEINRIQLLPKRDFDAAYDAIAVVRRKYLRGIAGAFLAKLDATAAVPGFDVTTWPPVVERARTAVAAAQQQSDPDAIAAGFAQAVSGYLRSVAAGLTSFVNGKVAAGSEKTKEYQAVLPQITAIVENVDAGKLDDAMTAASNAVTAVRGIATAAGQQMATASAMTAQLPQLALPSFESFRRAPPASQLGRATAAAIDVKVRVLDWVAAILAVALTFLIAYQALWAADLTWGGPLAYVAAVLWGAGIHQLAWTGLSGLVTALKG